MRRTSCPRRSPAATSACRRRRWPGTSPGTSARAGVTEALSRAARRAGAAHPLLAARHRPEPRRGRPDAGDAALRRHPRSRRTARSARAEVERRLEAYHRPYHRAVAAAHRAARGRRPGARPRRHPLVHAAAEGTRAAALAGRHPLAPRRAHRAAADRPAARRGLLRRRQRALLGRARGRHHEPARHPQRPAARADRAAPGSDRHARATSGCGPSGSPPSWRR